MSLPTWFRHLPLPSALKHIAGSAWLMMGRLFALGAIAAFGLAIFVGALSAIDSIFESRDQWYAEGHLADLELRVVADDVANFPRFDDIPGVDGYRLRMIFPASLDINKDNRLPALLIAATTNSTLPINTQKIIEGKALDLHDHNGVLIERNLARYHAIKVSDTLNVKLGKENVLLKVRGIVQDAEFLLAPANPSLFVPSKGSLGVLYANPQILSERFGFTPVNSVLFRLTPGANIETVRQTIQQRAQTRLNVDWLTSRTEQFSYQFLEKDLGVFRLVVPVIVLVSALSAIFVTAFLFAQWVMQERQMLGVFMALGHTRARLAVSFSVMFFYLAIAAILGGLVLALFICQGFAKNFAESIGLPLPQLVLTPTYITYGVAGVLGVFSLAGALAIRRVFLLTPRDAMRHVIALGHAPSTLGRKLGCLLPTTWLRMPLRNLFRNGKMSLMTIISVALGFGITASFFIAFSSFVGTSVNRVEQNTWDLAVDFVAPIWDENIDSLIKISGIADYTPYTKGVAQAIKNGRRTNLYIGGFDPAKPWHAIALIAGAELSEAQPNGMLLEQSTARELGINVGDPLTLEVQGRQHTVRIQGLFSGAMPGEARLPIAFHRVLADLENRSTGMFIRVNKKLSDINSVAQKFSVQADVQQVLSKVGVSKEILAASGQVTEIIHLGALVSIAIASLFVFACLGYLVLQRQGEYQTLRLLGYSDGLIRTMIIVEVLFMGLASLALAVPIAAITASYLNSKLSQAWFQIDTIITLTDYLKTFIPSFILLPLVALPIARRVLREPLESHLRLREVT